MDDECGESHGNLDWYEGDISYFIPQLEAMENAIDPALFRADEAESSTQGLSPFALESLLFQPQAYWFVQLLQKRGGKVGAKDKTVLRSPLLPPL